MNYGHQCQMAPQSTLNQQLINILNDTQLTPWSTLNHHRDQHTINILINDRLSFDWLKSINQHWMACLLKLVDSQLTVNWDIDQVSIKCCHRQQFSVNRVSIECRSRVLIKGIDWGYQWVESINQHLTANAFSTVMIWSIQQQQQQQLYLSLTLL